MGFFPKTGRISHIACFIPKLTRYSFICASRTTSLKARSHSTYQPVLHRLLLFTTYSTLSHSRQFQQNEMNGGSGKSRTGRNATPKATSEVTDKPAKSSFITKSHPLRFGSNISDASTEVKMSEGNKSIFEAEDSESVRPVGTKAPDSTPIRTPPSLEPLETLDLGPLTPSLSPSMTMLSEDSHEALTSHLKRLVSIHWESSSRSVASTLGEMLSVVNDLSSEVENSFDHEAPDSAVHEALRRGIQDELSEINELFSQYAERHPSICHDEESAETLFQQLQALGYDITHHRNNSQQARPDSEAV